ncbi:Metallo-hydrolase/oxidoreductase [Aulographum hederae CBS 113979]|uniref:Metallo-hydrolase/oxidoreductase n=1 Tax=Aulographum hederae CBS 113979 TaxID=1176131 RepID=A0A6G1GN79_9PEZI|nr:Metallo-hydrolase/oxidoreductase [Aulographum hederae CBS 113979]
MSSASSSVMLYAAAISSSQMAGAVPEDAKELKHHLKDGKGFVNPWRSYRDFTPFSIMKAMISHKFSGDSNSPDTTPPTVPVVKPEFLPSRHTPALRATWLGHACYYVEFPSGLRVLFDPVFTPRCSPLNWLGPKRYTEQPCNIDDIPTIDAVVISHSHYDHLSHPTVMRIKELHPNVHFFVPLKNKQWFIKCGIHNVTELDWWEARDIKLSATDSKGKAGEEDPKITETAKTKDSSNPQEILATIECLPCQHTSARTLFDKGHTLWASWSVQSGGKKVWFGGDTGYRAVPKLPKSENDYDTKYGFPHCPAFAEIGRLRGPFDLGLIPIGAYDPRFIMSSMHANPFDSVNIFLDVQCKRGLGMHWGTWVLTEEDVLEPPKLLREALRWKQMPEEGVFDVLDIGASRVYADSETKS